MSCINYERMSLLELNEEIKKCKDRRKKKLLRKLVEFKIQESYIEFHEKKIFEQNLEELVLNNMENKDTEEIVEKESTQVEYQDDRTKQITNMLLKDDTNNKMMDRLNSELVFRNNGYDKKIEKPFMNTTNITDDYYTKTNLFDIPVVDFSSKRIVKIKE